MPLLPGKVINLNQIKEAHNIKAQGQHEPLLDEDYTPAEDFITLTVVKWLLIFIFYPHLRANF